MSLGVSLGFCEECEPWQVQSYSFPSKVGGKPAWLDLANLPPSEKLQCGVCHNPLVFLCQIYAPFEESEANFHRTLFVFICKDAKCCQRNSSANIRVYRNSLGRRNDFYPFEPPQGPNPDFSTDKWTQLCNLCGCLGDKRCSKCQKVAYCSKYHQIIDWKEGHKSECHSGEISKKQLSYLFKEFEIIIESEELDEKSIDEVEEMEKFNKLQDEGKAGTLKELSSEDLETYATCSNDKAFMKFQKRISDYSEQIVRYQRNGEPLWIAEAPKPETVPKCDYCGEPRQFEFQIMPQLLLFLKEFELDIGVIVVYSCRKSCTEGESYKEEFVFKQDVALNT